MTARNTEVRLEVSSRHQGRAEALLLPGFRLVLTITGAKAVATSLPTLQGTESDFLTESVGRGRRTMPPGFWDCLSMNSMAGIEHSYLSASLEHNLKQVPS